MDTVSASEIAAQTQEQLNQLLEATAKKIELESKRAALEQDKVNNQKEILEKEKQHNKLLSKLVDTCSIINDILQNDVLETMGELRNKVENINKIQEVLGVFLIKEYEKLGDQKYEQVIKILEHTLKDIHKPVTNNVFGNISSAQDTNINLDDKDN